MNTTKPLCLSYASGSPMLAAYLRMNNLASVSVVHDSPGVWELFLTTEHGGSVGLVAAERRTKREAVALAREVSAHTGLPYFGVLS